MAEKLMNVGQFEIISGKVMVSDPCYERGTWCQASVENVKNGTWHASIERRMIHFDKPEYDHERIAALYAVQAAHADKVMELVWEDVDADIGVDSGQAGIFDWASYRNDADYPVVENRLHFNLNETGNRFYATCCDATDKGADVIFQGVVSTSGFGDGGYTLYVAKDEEGMVIGMNIVFIDEEAEK